METTLQAAAGSPSRVPIRGYAWFTLGWTVLTIIVGAVVRATHSGDGCGKSWPGCADNFVPTSTENVSRIIEFSHRTVSGLNLVFVAVLMVMVLRMFASGHPARRSAVASMIFIIFEAAIGALIVLYGWVAHDTSTPRQVSVPLHLVNTFALTAVLALTVWHVREGGRLSFADRRLVRQLGGLALLILLMAATGATTSLADTLFRADTLGEGLAQDFDSASALIVRLRVLHPFVAVSSAALIGWFVWHRLDEVERAGRTWPARFVLICLALQVGLGVLHIALLTPLATGLMHLAVALVLWLAFAFFAFGMLAGPRQTAAAR